MGKTGFFLYIGDYLKDTRCLTAEARGCYVDWLCVLFEYGGTVTWPVANFAQYSGVSEDTALHVLNQLSLTNVADVEWQTHSKGIAKDSKIVVAKLSNRRMVREARKQVEIRGKRIEAGRAGGSKRWQNSDSKHSTLLNPSPSLLIKDTLAQPGFAEFWSVYPKKKSKGQAEKAWKALKVTPELLETILKGVARAKRSRGWLKDSGQYIPHPATWLNAKGWEDQEFVSYSAAPSPPKAVEPEKPSQEEIDRSQEFLRDTIHSLAGKMGRIK